MEIGLLLLRLLLAGIFTLAGVAKFLDLRGSEKAFKAFGVPAAIALPSSVALSIAEIVIALLFLFTSTSWYAAIGGAGLLVLFIVQMIYQMAKGNAPDCHCFGQLHSEPVGYKSIVRNIVLAGLTFVLVARGNGQQGPSLADPTVDLIQVVFGIVIIGGLGVAIAYLRKITDQQRELMRRMDIIEVMAQDGGGSVERADVLNPAERLPIGAPFPDFELSAINGDKVSRETLMADGRSVLFFFVSPACDPCQALAPEIVEWRNDLAGRVNCVLVSSGSAKENVDKFGEQAGPVLLQKKRELADEVKAQWTPTAILMNAAGSIASHVAVGDKAIRDLVERVIAAEIEDRFTHFENANGHSHKNKIGESIPEFSLEDTRGNRIEANAFTGRQTLVTFWSPTCPHCKEMMSDLRKWDKGKGADEPALVVFSDGERDEHERLGLKSPIVLDSGYKTAEKFGMFGTPSAVLVDGEGKIVSETAVGAADIWALVGKRK